jgi:hypothetical protein
LGAVDAPDPLMRGPHLVPRTLILASFLAACAGREGKPAANARDSATRPPPPSLGIVDSALPPEEAMRRFREGLPVVTRLEHGARSRDALVQRFARAVERRDTADVRAMVLSRAEFAHLYFPSSALSRPPYQQPPALAWFLILANSQKGISRVFERHAGRPLGLRSYACKEPPRRDGENVVWDGCRLQLDSSGRVLTRRLFGSIIERDGRYKFLSYANDY